MSIESHKAAVNEAAGLVTGSPATECKSRWEAMAASTRALHELAGQLVTSLLAIKEESGELWSVASRVNDNGEAAEEELARLLAGSTSLRAAQIHTAIQEFTDSASTQASMANSVGDHIDRTVQRVHGLTSMLKVLDTFIAQGNEVADDTISFQAGTAMAVEGYIESR
jgi:hypothetical protein